jgi:hypothetical protein
MADGYLKIKTKLDNSGIDKDIIALEDKIKVLENKNMSNRKEEKILQDQVNKYEELLAKADEYKTKISELQTMNGGKLTVSNPAEMAQLQMALAEANQEIDRQSNGIRRVYSKLDRVKQKQQENNLKIQEYKAKIDQINTKNMEKGIDNVKSKLTSTIGQIGKMAMAVVGVRTAWNMVTRAVNLVKQYNPQVSADFEYMGYCIANIIAPAIQGLVKILFTVLSYVNAITTAWFGLNLFSNSSVQNFQKMRKSASGTAKSAKEIQKSLAGFDEMNVIQDNKSSSGATPSVDLSKMQGEVPQWLQWIIDNKDIMLGILASILAGIIAIKFGLTGIQGLGISVLIMGIISLIKDVKAQIENPSWQNFGKILTDIGVILAGLALIFGGWPLIIAAAIAVVVGLIIQNWDTIKGVLSTVGQWIWNNVLLPVWNFIKGVIDIIVAIFWNLVSVLDGITTTIGGMLKAPFENMEETAKSVFKGVKEIFEGVGKVFKGIFTGDMKTALEGFKQIFKGIFDSLWAIAKAPLNLIIRGINSLIRGANKIKFDVPDWVPGIGGKSLGFSIPQIPLLAKGGIISRPTQAILGEAGKEAVMPLENNTEWIDILADKLAGKISSSGSTNVYLDGRLIQRQMAKRSEELAFATNR